MQHPVVWTATTPINAHVLEEGMVAGADPGGPGLWLNPPFGLEHTVGASRDFY